MTLKEYIDHTKTYDLTDVQRFISEPNADFHKNLEKQAPNKTGILLKGMLASFIGVSNVSATEIQTANDLFSSTQEKIHQIDSNHIDYINYLHDTFSIGQNRKNELIQKILAFKSLIDNWDGYGAIPSEIATATQGIELISMMSARTLNKISEIFPTTNGTIGFIWENNSNERVSFEIGANDYSFYTKLNGLTPKFFSGEISNFNWISVLEEEVRKL